MPNFGIGNEALNLLCVAKCEGVRGRLHFLSSNIFNVQRIGGTDCRGLMDTVFTEVGVIAAPFLGGWTVEGCVCGGGVIWKDEKEKSRTGTS